MPTSNDELDALHNALTELEDQFRDRPVARGSPPSPSAVEAAARQVEATTRMIEDLHDKAHTRLTEAQSKVEHEIRVLRSSTPARSARRWTERLSAARETLRDMEIALIDLREREQLSAKDAVEWERRAMEAITAGNDTLAKEALQRKREHESLHRALGRECEYGTKVMAILRDALDLADAQSTKP